MPSIEDQVVEFFNELFDRIFARSFCEDIDSRIRRNMITRQIEEAADASSQSLLRFFLNQHVPVDEVHRLLTAIAEATDDIGLKEVANVHVSPEELVERLSPSLPSVADYNDESQVRLRLALHSVVQVLLMIGPVMAEWQRVAFSSTFELPRQVVTRLNQVTEQLQVLGEAGQEAADQSFELIYRDYLLQRFHRVEAGTIRMTTNLDVDLRELFVMPQVKKRRSGIDTDENGPDALLDLQSAKKSFREVPDSLVEGATESSDNLTALAQVELSLRSLFIGAPGSGKSTFLEWLQVKVAGAEEELIMGGQQAIPILLRLRQLDTEALPTSRDLVAKATLSADRASLMPVGWTERQLDAGRILFMVDGLDEVEPAALERRVLPWISTLIKTYPRCRYVLSSRPVGYRGDKIGPHKFAIYELADFGLDQMKAYARNWCTARRLARNELEVEARREGASEGEAIVDSFAGHPYIRDLARNPLMLSAICLVNFFEGGRLPEDRVMLYRLCVEGLLHNWDQRRGIYSDFTMDEKLRACRELALAMQAHDQAECADSLVRRIFIHTLNDEQRAKQLLEHIRYRSGLLLERRPDIFAFAHLTFQEYLAARAVHEGNQQNVDVSKIVMEHAEGRWDEVIPLYCGLAPAPDARRAIKLLLTADETKSLGVILGDAYISAGAEVAQDTAFRKEVLIHIANTPSSFFGNGLTFFQLSEASQIANATIGLTTSTVGTSAAYWFLSQHPDQIDPRQLQERLNEWRELSAVGLSEIIHLSFNEIIFYHNYQLEIPSACFSSSGPSFYEEDKDEDMSASRESYATQAEIALMALLSLTRGTRYSPESPPVRHSLPKDGLLHALEQIVVVISNYNRAELETLKLHIPINDVEVSLRDSPRRGDQFTLLEEAELSLSPEARKIIRLAEKIPSREVAGALINLTLWVSVTERS